MTPAGVFLILFQLLDWHLQLDRSLPAPLDMVGEWLHEAEGALRQEIIVQQAHDVTANTVHRALEQHKVSIIDRRDKRQLECANMYHAAD